MPKKTIRKPRMGNNKFRSIKTMLEAGVSKTAIKKVLGTSYNTIILVDKSESLEDYWRLHEERKQTRLNNKVTQEPKREVTIDIGDMVFVLGSIESKLDMVIDKLNERKGFFG